MTLRQLFLLNFTEMIINHTEGKTYQEELVEDVLSIISVFSAKLYGSRSHKKKEIVDVTKGLFKPED